MDRSTDHSMDNETLLIAIGAVSAIAFAGVGVWSGLVALYEHVLWMFPVEAVSDLSLLFAFLGLPIALEAVWIGRERCENEWQRIGALVAYAGVLWVSERALDTWIGWNFAALVTILAVLVFPVAVLGIQVRKFRGADRWPRVGTLVVYAGFLVLGVVGLGASTACTESIPPVCYARFSPHVIWLAFGIALSFAGLFPAVSEMDGDRSVLVGSL